MHIDYTTVEAETPLLPTEALRSIAAWLQLHEGATQPVRAERCSGGFSNLTFRLRDEGGRAWILRRPPLGHQGGHAHDVLREVRVMRALADSDIPVPAVLLSSAEGPDLGFTYAVVQHVAGVIVVDRLSAECYGPAARRELAFAAMAVLARIHAVPIEASGFDVRSREGSYLARQIERWSAQPALETSDTTLEGHLAAASSTLPDGRALVHGDFHLGNLIASSGGQVRAVVDWEMATIGDPLVDLGCALAYWQQPGDDERLAPLASGVVGFPTRHEMADHYGAVSGRGLGGLDVYVAFGHWKLACIAANILDRLQQGAMGKLEIDATMLRDQVITRRHLAESALDGEW
jgi:aminoglycoside phosphotransferase (APT) family kinase protein